MRTQSLQIEDIRLDGGTQPRASINADVVTDYRERMEAGDAFPPVDVFYDGSNYWLADGFHRVNASIAADFKTIEATIHQGSQADAQWYSYKANREHDKAGLKRTNEDKRRAVEAALRTHPGKSDRERRAGWRRTPYGRQIPESGGRHIATP